jgi:hypothetical protein
MYRLTCRLLLFGGFLLWAATPSADAQSKKKRGGPMVEIAGAKSQTFEHWKQEKSDKGTYKFDLGKPPDDKTPGKPELTVTPVKGTEQEIFSDLKQKLAEKDRRITGPEDRKAGPFKARYLYMVGFPPGNKDRYRVIGYLLDTKDGKYLITMAGPSALIGIHQVDVESWLKDFK